jgi:ribosomal protein S18 acetylase RimI-like enzyme
MNITYRTDLKELPCDQLYRLFDSAGWVKGETEPESDRYKHFNAPFINSALVVSAWEGDLLVGTVRVLSDKIIRSVIYDLVVLPEYKSIGIGKELIKICREQYPNSEWVVQTESHIAGYYEKMGFKLHEAVLTIPSRW